MARLIDEAMKLPPAERLALAEKLLESVEEGELDEAAVQGAWAQELRRRSDELRAGRVKGLTLDEARAVIASDSDDER